MNPKNLWNKFKGLKWYWKVLLGVFFLLAIVITFLSLRRVPEITPEEVVEFSREKTDDRIESFQTKEQKRRGQRQKLKAEREEMKELVEQINEEHDDIMADIDGAGSADELLSIADELRKRNR